MHRISKWFREMWPYALAAVFCGAVIPTVGMSQTKSADLYLIMMLMVLPTCTFMLGCIHSLRTQQFSGALLLITLLSGELFMVLPFILQGIHFASVLVMAVIAAIPAFFFLISEVFFLMVRMYGDREMSWIGYFALLLICLPLASDLLVASSTTVFTIASIAMGLSCAAVVLFMWLYKRELSFSLSGWTLMLGFPLLLLYKFSGPIDIARAAVVLLLPTASTLFTTALIGLIARLHK